MAYVQDNGDLFGCGFQIQCPSCNGNKFPKEIFPDTQEIHISDLIDRLIKLKNKGYTTVYMRDLSFGYNIATVLMVKK